MANLLCELDAPNEYYIDTKSQTLYFFPPVPLESWTKGPFLTQQLVAMNVSGASHITLRGLGVHHSRGNGLLATDVTGGEGTVACKRCSSHWLRS